MDSRFHLASELASQRCSRGHYACRISASRGVRRRIPCQRSNSRSARTTVSADKHESSKRQWRLPMLQGLLPFDKSRLGADIMAGITLAALGIPEVMGYTKIIGTPVVTGLYTLLLPVLAFA